MNSLRLVAVLATVALAACNRSDGGGSTVAPGAATSLAYTQTTFDLRVGVESPALVPVVSGSVLDYTIEPPLPAGLVFDAMTGVLSGTPMVAAPFASYIVRARVPGGALLTAQLELTVHSDFPAARFAYSLNLFPSSINTWRIDDQNEQLVSAAGLAVDGAPVRAAAHPLGDRLFVLDFQGGRVLSYAIDPDDGNLQLVDSDPTGPFPLALAVSPDGRFVFTGSADRLSAFRVDPVSRRLVASTAPFFLPEVVAIEILPGGDRLALSSTRFDALGIVSVDPETGAFTGLLGSASLPTPYAMASSKDGSRLHAASFGTNVIDTFDIAAPSPNLTMLDRVSVPAGTFDIELRNEHLWAAHYGAKSLTRFTLDANGVPAAKQTVQTPGSAPRVRAIEGGGYAVPIFDIGIAQLGGAPGDTPRLQALRPFACDLVIAPAPTSRSRSTPFSIVLDADLGALSILSSADGSTLVGPIPTGPGPRALASGGVGDRLAVGDGSTGSFRRFEVDAQAPNLTATGATTSAGFTVRDLAYDGDGRRLWVMTSNQLVTYDVRGPVPLQVDQTTLGPSPTRLATDPAGRFLVVTDSQDDVLRIMLVGPNTNDPFLGVGSPFALRDVGDPPLGASASSFEPGGRYLFLALESVGEVRSYEIGPINASVHFVATLPGLGKPVDIAISPSGDRAFVADAAGPALHLLAIDDTGVPSLVDTVVLTQAPRRLVMSADGSSIQLIGEAGAWQRYAAVEDELTELAAVETGLTNPIDFVSVTVWLDDVR